MPPLDLLDSVTSGHVTHPSPEREPATNSHDGPGDGYPTLPNSHVFNLPYRPTRQNATPINNNYPPPPPQSSPPAYRPTPPQQPRTFTSWHRTHRTRKALLHWHRLVYLDILFMLLALTLAYIMMRFSHVVFRWNQRFFPMTWDPVSGKWYGPAELSYPHSTFILSVVFTGVLIPAVGVVVIVGMQLWVRSFWDANAGLFGLFKGLVMMTFIQIFLKQWIGEFRPYFITLCNPVLSPPNMAEKFPFRRFVTPDCCKPKPGSSKHAQLSAMQSFPSGHTSESFFVGTFLALYLNAKLKAFSDYHTSFWKWLAVMFPLFGSCLIAGTLLVDRNHHVHDILLSIPWGVVIAFLAYRSHYASIFNYRTNHLPLPWSGTRQSLHPTIPAPETEHGDNLAAVTWPRKPVEHSFDGEREQPTGLGLDGAADRLRGPRNISRGRLRQNIFPQPTPLMQNRSGAIVLDGRGEFELRDIVDVDPVAPDVVAAEPSTARATGHQMDLEGQRQRRWTLESGEEMG